MDWTTLHRADYKVLPEANQTARTIEQLINKEFTMPQPPGGTIPHLIVEGAAKAIDFYVKAFGAKEISRNAADDGKRLMHAEVEINGSVVYLADDFPEYCGGKSRSPKALGGSPISLHLNVPNCDAAYNRAVEAGATPSMPPADVFWGARYAMVTDPFGHMWAFMHPLAK